MDHFLSARLHAISSMCRHGFTLQLNDCKFITEFQQREAAKRWAKVIDSILGSELQREFKTKERDINSSSRLSRLPQLFAFGYGCGYQICQLLGGSEANCDHGGLVSSTFNMFASLFDAICDDSDYDTLGVLISAVNKAGIMGGLHGDPLSSFESIGTPFIVKVTLRLLARHLAMCHEFSVGSPERLPLYEELCSTMLDAYAAQVRSINCKFAGNTLTREDVITTLFAKSVLPSWIFFLTSAMSVSKLRPIKIDELKNCAIGIGRAIWIADDIRDLGSDLETHKWNYLWALLSYDHDVSLLHQDGMLEEKSLLLRELYTTGVIDNAVRELCQGLRDSFAKLETLSDSFESEKFQRALEARLKLWILAG